MVKCNIKLFVLFSVLLLLISTSLSHAATVHRKRDAGEETTTQKEGGEEVVEKCAKSIPCGWAVYTPFTRVVNFFIKNTCECPESKNCVRNHDDISVSAYVYSCQDQTT